MSRSNVARLAVLLCGLFVAVPATAEVDWSLALRSDADITKALTGLSTEAPGAEDAPAVQMLREVGWEILPGSRLLYRNLVLQVRDPDAIADIASSFYLDARGSVESAQAFTIRDGALSRPDVRIERGDGEVKRTRLAIDLAGLAPGDLVGFSSITRFDNVLYFDTIPMSAPMPVAEFSLRIRCEQSHMYAVHAVGDAELDVQVVDRIDARPVEWHATARGLETVPSVKGGGLYDPGMSLALVAESAEFVPAANAWITTLAWQRVALFLAGLRESGLASMVGARDQAPTIVAGASTDADREAAVFSFVRDELDLLLGAAYEPLGYRKGEVVLESGQANPMEKVLLMITLLDALGIDGEIGVVRTQRWGPLGEQLKSFVQFHDLAVVCGKDQKRYYVPYVAGAEAGVLPAQWGPSWVLAPAPGLMEKVSQASSQVMSTPNVDVHAAFLQVREQAAELGWYSLEQVGAGSR
jgi:hypothetical protein